MDERDVKPAEEASATVEGFWEDPRNIMRLIDLIFLFQEDEERLPRS